MLKMNYHNKMTELDNKMHTLINIPYNHDEYDPREEIDVLRLIFYSSIFHIVMIFIFLIAILIHLIKI